MPERIAGSGEDGPLREHSEQLPTVAQAVGRLGLLWLVLALIACVPVAVWWVARVVNVPEHGWFEGPIGLDFSVFYTAGALISDGAPETLYDVELFNAEHADRTGRARPASSPMFGSPPAFAVVMAPLTWMPWQEAWIVWTVLSLAALAVALAGLGIEHVLFTVVIVLLTLPGYVVIIAGQSTFFWLLIIAAVFASLRRGWNVAAGAMAGLLILKPPLLIGFGVWWLIDRRMHRTLLAAMPSAAAVLLLSLPIVGRAWLEYPVALLRYGEMHRDAPGRWAQYSPWGFGDLLVPGHPVLATIVGVAASAFGVAAFVLFYRKHRDEWQLLFAASIIATLWISPHALPYDWALLVVPLAVIWRARSGSWGAWLKASVLLAFAAQWSYLFLLWSSLLPIGQWQFQVQFAVPAFAAVAWYLARELGVTAPGEAAGSS